MNQELFLRQDILQFCSKLDSENYNIKAYRKRNTHHTNRTNKKVLLSTEIYQSDFNQEQRLEKSMEKAQRVTQIFSAKRFSATAAVKKRSAAIDMSTYVKTARTKNHSYAQQVSEFQQNKERIIINKIPDPQNIAKRKFSKQQKQYNKGGKIQNKHLENWLNQILLEYCHDEKFQTNIQNSALKKYSIDKNSLLSKGINPQSFQRIYKSLFVYSMGFNAFLKEISLKNMDLKKTLWKVYAILLEYCSDGDFETMIGQIQRDKIHKMEKMKNEIQKRQQIIQNNEEIHQQKNAKIFKELKILRENNKNLQNDKNVLMEDFKEAQQAFNEQVSLRLKFQSKINEIHGVHRQLTIKHQKLYDDFQLKNYQCNNSKEKYDKINNAYIILKNDFDCLKKQFKKSQQLLQLSNGALEQMKKNDIRHDIFEIQWKHKKQQFNYMLGQRDKRIDQLKNQLKNAQLMIQMKDKSQQQLQKEYKRSLDQNNQLIQSLQTQLNKINELMMQKKQFNQANSIFFAQISILKEKLEQKQQYLKKCTATIDQFHRQKREQSIEIQLLTSKNNESILAINDLYKKIQQMKRIKTQIQQELYQYKSKQEIYKNYYKQKQRIISQMSEQINTLQKSISEFAISKKNLQSKIALLNQKMIANEEGFKKKTQKIIAENRQMDTNLKKLKEQLQQNASELQKYKIAYEETYNKLKDQLFERNDLELKYNQSLSVVQSENDHIKTLNIRISELQERNEQMQRKCKGMEFILEQKEKTYKSQLHLLQNTNNRLKQEVKMRNNFIHPMQCEDLQSCLMRSQKLIEEKCTEMQGQKKKIQRLGAFQMKIKTLNQQILNLKIKHQQQLSKKYIQIELYRQKYENATKKIQILQESPSKNVQQPNRYNYKQKQLKYLEIIKEKSARIDELLKELQRMHDNNNQMLIKLNETQTILKQNKFKMDDYERQIKKNQVQRQNYINQKSQLLKQKEKIINTLNSFQLQSKQLDQENKNCLNRNNIQSREGRSQQKYSRQEVHSKETERQRGNQPNWRNDFAKKVKNATNYYKN